MSEVMAGEIKAPSTTTAEEDRRTHGQRRINIMWETTQAVIAVGVVGANIAAAFILSESSPMLSNAFFLVIGFYFGRTNHARFGGTQVFDKR